MEDVNACEVSAAQTALDALIDAVHEVALSARRTRCRRVEPHDNVISVSVPTITDLPFHGQPWDENSRRVVAAISIRALAERVDVMFELDTTSAVARFVGDSALAEELSVATNVRLAQVGCPSRRTRIVSAGPSGVTSPSDR